MSGLHVWGPREATFPGSRGCPLHAAGPGCFQVGGLGCRRGNGPGKVKRPYAESLGWVVVRAGIVTQADLILISVPRGAFLSAPTPKGLLSRPTPCVVLPALPRALERRSLFDAAHFARWVSGQLGLRGWAPPGLEQREGGMPSLSPQASQLRDPAAPWLWGLGKHFTCLRQSSPVRGAVCWPRLGQLSEGRRLGAVRRAWG